MVGCEGRFAAAFPPFLHPFTLPLLGSIFGPVAAAIDRARDYQVELAVRIN